MIRASKVWIERESEVRLLDAIRNKECKTVLIEGVGGIGKSSLLLKIKKEHDETPQLFIDLSKIDNTDSRSMAEILLDNRVVEVKNAPRFGRIRQIIDDEYDSFFTIADTYESEFDGIKKQLSKDEKSEFGIVVTTLIDAYRLVSKPFRRKEQQEKKEIVKNPELKLLEALKVDFEGYGLFLVDTFEKTHVQTIETKVRFDGLEITPLREIDYMRFGDYVVKIIDFLHGSTLCLVAGRNVKQMLKTEELHDVEVEKIEIKRFSRAQVKDYLSSFFEHKEELIPDEAGVDSIESLTNGNPLLVELFAKMVAKEHSSWQDIDIAALQKRFEHDESFGFLYYLLERIISHVGDGRDLYKLVVPRVLTKAIMHHIGDDELLVLFMENGLAYKGEKISDYERYYLHDDVKTGILNHARHTLKTDLPCWHANEQVAPLHQKLLEYYKKFTYDKKMRTSVFEPEHERLFHQLMLKKEFEKEGEISREVFAESLFGSISLNYKEKRRVVESELSPFQIRELSKVWKEEQESFLSKISPRIYSIIRRLSKEGRLPSDWSKNKKFFETLNKEHKLDNDPSIYLLIASATDDNEEEIEVYDALLTRFEKDESPDILKQIAQALYNKGVTLGQLNRSEEAIEVYDALLTRFEKDESPDILTTVAQALVNKGATLGQLNRSEEEIEVYDALLTRFEKDESPDILTTVAQALVNKGVTLGQLNRSEEAIEVYDALLTRFEKDESPDILKQIAQALYNKGVRLGQLNRSEEEIEVYDALLTRFEKDESPEIQKHVAQALNNKLELSLIDNKPFSDAHRTLLRKLNKDNPESCMQSDMLEILYLAKQSKMQKELELWLRTYKNMTLGNWSFVELDTWADSITDGIVSKRVKAYLEIFKSKV